MSHGTARTNLSVTRSPREHAAYDAHGIVMALLDLRSLAVVRHEPGAELLAVQAARRCAADMLRDERDHARRLHLLGVLDVLDSWRDLDVDHLHAQWADLRLSWVRPA